MKSSITKFVGLTAVYALIACGGKGSDNPIAGVAALCGFVCPGDKVDGVTLGGIKQGNTSISGIQEVDAFFSAVLNFETAATGVSDGIQAQLDAIKVDFGIDGNDLAAGLKAKLDANLEAKLSADYEPAKCAVDAQATLEASAKCDASVTGGMATVECKGSCEADVSAKVDCDAEAEVYCTATAPSIKCEGECQGSCDVALTAKAECKGTCNGTCDGTCTSFSDDTGTQCNGQCTGMCMGHCVAELAAKASCEGSCTGECTAKAPMADCSGKLHAECRGKADASIMCKGRCTGEFTPPMVKAECEASAKAQASVHVECTPPRLAIHASIKASADAQFKAAMRVLIDTRLPALLQAVGKGNVIAKAGDDLGVAAKGAVKGAATALKANTKLKAAYGLGCAIGQLDDAQSIVKDAADGLSAQLMASKSLTVLLGLDS
jgi:hypothetical protein